jgi:hypothetical protein
VHLNSDCFTLNPTPTWARQHAKDVHLNSDCFALNPTPTWARQHAKDVHLCAVESLYACHDELLVGILGTDATSKMRPHLDQGLGFRVEGLVSGVQVPLAR